MTIVYSEKTYSKDFVYILHPTSLFYTPSTHNLNETHGPTWPEKHEFIPEALFEFFRDRPTRTKPIRDGLGLKHIPFKICSVYYFLWGNLEVYIYTMTIYEQYTAFCVGAANTMDPSTMYMYVYIYIHIYSIDINICNLRPFC